MSLIKIVLTGPESTGKSTLASELAQYFGGGLILEYAREYVANLDRPYTMDDLDIIAKKQVAELKEYELQNPDGLVFLDTYLDITKVWFEVVYQQCPAWIPETLKNSGIDLFLLCEPDIPWLQDGIRENGGEMRNWLYAAYESNLKQFNLTYGRVSGIGKARLDCAIHSVCNLTGK